MPPEKKRPIEDVELTDVMVVRIIAVAASAVTYFGTGNVGNTAVLLRAREIEKYILTGG